jgi:lipoate-protein ligase A
MWRLIDSGCRSAAFTAAADEAILAARAEDTAPTTLHLYRRDAPAVSLGYFQKVGDCVDLEAAKREGISLVRRMSGGSAIFSDRGQLTYCLVAGESELPGTVEEVFEKVCGALIDALSRFGLQAEHHRPNDVLINGRKISGSAQVRRLGCIAQHGTVLVDTDLELMDRVLRAAKRPRDGMTTMALELGRAPAMDEVAQAVVDGFQRTFGVTIARGHLTDGERGSIAHLLETKYSTERHTFMR